MERIKLAIEIVKIRESKLPNGASLRFNASSLKQNLESKIIREYEKLYGYASISTYTTKELKNFIRSNLNKCEFFG